MKTKYKYIHFEKARDLWECRDNKTRTGLGWLEFYEPWKQWVFTVAATSIVFSADCLADIQDFMKGLK